MESIHIPKLKLPSPTFGKRRRQSIESKEFIMLEEVETIMEITNRLYMGLICTSFAEFEKIHIDARYPEPTFVLFENVVYAKIRFGQAGRATYPLTPKQWDAYEEGFYYGIDRPA